MKRHSLTILLSAVLLLLSTPKASAEVIASGTCGIDGDNLTWQLTSDSILTISGTGAMGDWESSSQVPWYLRKSQIQHVVLSDGVTSIGTNAFNYCTNLTSVELANTITSIGNTAFFNCYRITDLNIPNSVTSIGSYTFRSCGGLSNINIPNSVTNIGNGAFRDCHDLSTIVLPNSISNIGDYLFEGCSKLENIAIPNSVTSIGKWAFYSCKALKNVTIPSSVESIGERAFSDDPNLQNVTIPSSVTSIGSVAFSIVANIIYHGEAAGSPWGARCVNGYVDGFLVFNDSTKTTLLACLTAASGDIEIPNTVKSIEKNAFYYCNDISSITIPRSVTDIKIYAFDFCGGIQSIMVEEGNTIYNSRNNCNAIIKTSNNTLIVGCQNTIIPSGIVRIESRAFAGCTGLKSIEIPNTVTSIGSNAFYSCTSLDSIEIPQSVTNIESAAFQVCSSLRNIVIPNSVTDIRSSTFSGCSGLKSIVIPNSIKSIGTDAFSGCNSFETVYISDLSAWCKISFTSNSLNNAKHLILNGSEIKDLIIPNEVTKISDYAFSRFPYITSVTIPNSVTSIGNGAFSNCSQIKSVSCACVSPPSVGSDAFKSISKSILIYVPLESIAAYQVANGWKDFTNIRALPCVLASGKCGTVGDSTNLTWELSCDSTLYISGSGAMAEWNSSSLTPWYSSRELIKKVVIGNNITSIGMYAFNGCVNLTGVDISNSITSIGQSALEGCSALTKITCEAITPPAIQNYTFNQVPKSILLYIPSECVEAYQNATGWKDFTNIRRLLATGTCGASGDNLTWRISSDSILTISGIGAMADNSYSNTPWYSSRNLIKNIVIGNRVSSIGRYAFHDCSGLTSITIPTSVTSIGYNAFYRCTGLTRITCEATTPPVLDSDAFYNVDASVPLYVPAESIEAYVSASGWNKFTIRAITDDPTACASIYGTCTCDNSWWLGAPDRNSTPKTAKKSFESSVMYWELTCDSILIISGEGAIPDYAVPSYYWSPEYYTHSGWGAGGIGHDPSIGACETPWYSQRSMIVEVQISAGVTSIGNNAFSGCEKLRSISIANSVVSIGGGAFYNCRALASVSIPNGVTSIGDGAFDGCSTLTSITIPDQVTTIGKGAFGNCSNLTSISIPNSVTSIGEGAFYNCGKLASLVVESGNTIYDSRNNCNAIIETATNTLIAGCKNSTVPSDITAIANWAFSGSNGLVSVTLPATLETIGQGAFNGCVALTGLSIPGSVTSIGKGAFNGCAAITAIVIPSTVTAIQDYTFEGCSSLASVTLPSTMTSIGYDAFYNCNGLTSLTSNATTPPSLGSYVFSNVNKSIPVYVPSESVEAYQAATGWKDFTNIQAKCILASGTCGAEGDNLTWELSCDSVLTISGTGAMANWSYNSMPWYSYKDIVKEIVIGNNVTNIGKYAFYYCSKIKSVNIPNSVTLIGERAFNMCRTLTSICIPSSITSIGEYAFLSCNSLSAVYISDIAAWCRISFKNNDANPLYHAKHLYENGSEVTSVIFPDGTTTIKNFVFYNCTSLTSVTIPNSVTSIGSSAFAGCTSLTSITIPLNVIDIGGSTFKNCKSLASITCKAQIPPTTKLDEVFSNVNKSIPLYVPRSGIKAYRLAENWKDFTNIIPIEEDITPKQVGALIGVFSVGSDKHICFSQGNLQYNKYDYYTGRWQLASSQYEVLGTKNQTDRTLIDLFGWGTSGYDSKYPTLTSDICSDYVSNSADIASTNYDWGRYISISNGAAEPGVWRTLTAAEWRYLLYERPAASQLIGKGTIAGVNGYVLLPDDWYCPIGMTFSNAMSSFMDNIYTATEWGKMEKAGAVFLPSKGGYRSGTGIINYETSAEYWTSSTGGEIFNNKKYANSLYLADTIMLSISPTFMGLSVRLVCDTILPPCILASGTCGASGSNLTWELSCDSVLTISGSGKYSVYTYINSAPWYPYRSIIKAIVINEGLTDASNYMFMDCSAVTSVILPKSLTKIGYSMFDGCTSLAHINIPKTVTHIQYRAFGDCSSLESIFIPKSVTSIASEVFCGCNNLSEIVVEDGNAKYDSRNNSNSIIETASNKLLWGCKNTTIPNSVTCIASGAFSRNEGLISIVIPNSVTTIEGSAFNICQNLESITLGNGLTSIGDNAFSLCSSLTSINIPDNVTSIGEHVFSSCSKLSSVTIGNGVTTIGRDAFEGCKNLDSIIIPKNVTSIGSSAFEECNKLTKVSFEGETPPSMSSAFITRDIFYHDPFDNIALDFYVPCGSKDAYMEALNDGVDSQSNSYISETHVIEEYKKLRSIGSSAPEIGSVVILHEATCDAPTLSFEATPAEGYEFVHWSDGNTDNPRTLTLTQDTTITAIFAEKEVDITSVGGVWRVSTARELGYAWKNAQDGETIKLAKDITLSKILWLGTAKMNDISKSLTLDLNGYTLSQTDDLAYMFVITHGELNVITSVAGGKIIQNNAKNQELFRVTGSTYKNVNPKTATSGFYSHLTIGEGVTVEAKVKNALVVDVIDNGNFWTNAYAKAAYVLATAGTTAPTTLPYSTRVYTSSKGVANGVRVDVYGTIYGEKYAFKANGLLGSPSNAAAASLDGFYADPTEEVAYTINAGDVDYAPFIYIHSSADLRVPASNTSANKPVAIYCSGYARWLIEGTCVGSTGVYVRAGDVDINNATIQSNYGGEYIAASAAGATAAGSAIVVAANNANPGDIAMTISGDSYVTATNGYAVDEAVTYASETEVNTITITGGTFDGGAVPDPENPEQIIQGIINIGGMTPDEFISDQGYNVHTVYIENGMGGVVMVVVEGFEPSPETSIIDAPTGASVNWKNAEDDDNDMVETLTTNLSLNELVINQNYHQSLTIADGATLSVERVILGSKAKIIVEAGGTLIVRGEQGITSVSVDNLLLKTSNDKQARFLINPAVKANRHPRARVQLYSQSFYENGGEYKFQRFAIPTYTAPGISFYGYDNNIRTRIWEYSADLDAWRDLSSDGVQFTSEDAHKLNTPFAVYNLMTYSPEPDQIVTMTGELIGTDNAVLNLPLKWNGFANSYSADIDIKELISNISANYPHVAGTIYLYDAIYDRWYEINIATSIFHPSWPKAIAPMQSFVLARRSLGSSVVIDYEDVVYNPAIEALYSAPARSRSIGYNTAVDMTLTSETGKWDNLLLVEDDAFTSDYDDSYDAEKYMNDDVNIYAHSDEKMGIVASDNIADTYLGFSTVKGGTFTLRFGKTEGRAFDLIDLQTGTRITADEGATYTFSAGKRTVADYRFQLVERKPVATDTEAVSTDSNATGIYTVMGQYIGEMNIFNSLPAGVYIVNGKKTIK